MNLSGVMKFLVGFTLAIALLFFTGVSITRYFITRLTAPPPKPIFPNDSPTAIASPRPVSPAPTAVPTAPNPASPSAVSPSPTATQPKSPSPTAEASPTPSPADEPGAYNARVTQSRGLVLRQNPNREAERVGGVRFNQELTVLGTSDDGRWLRVRLESGEEGWVRAGNTERLD